MSNLPDLEFFYFDRVWLKAYPYFFSNLRISDFMDTFLDYRNNGVFASMTYNAFTLYRTLDCIRRAIDRGYSLKLLEVDVDRCRDVRRYGEQVYYRFRVAGDVVYVNTSGGRFGFTLDQVRSVRLITYTTVVGDRLHYEKSIYIEYYPWLRVMVKPFVDGFIPPMIRVFYNPLIRAKDSLGIDSGGFEFQHYNFIDPGSVDLDKFVRVNHRFAFDRGLVDFIEGEWVKWFGMRENLRVKVSQVEVAYDTYISKIDLASALHTLGGRSKTIKYSLDDGLSYAWSDSGLKYYVTVKRGFQVKTYTKAWSSDRVLNRLEFTVNVNSDLLDLDAGKVLGRDDVVDAYITISKALMSGEKINVVIDLLKPLVKCRSECERHYAFWLDILTAGEIRGLSYYSGVVKIYKKLGLIKVKGRGRYSVYVLNENLIPFSEKLRNILGSSLRNLHTHKPKQTDIQN